MKLLFENWRRYQKETLNEARQVEYLGDWVGRVGARVGDLKHIYVVDGQAYYTSSGRGGITKKGDVVQFGGIIEIDVVPGPDGPRPATRKHRNKYIRGTRTGTHVSYGEVYKGEWVIKNPAGKDIGDISQKIRNLEAEKKGRIMSTEDVNKALKKRGILRVDWAVQHGIEHIDFPGVTKVKRSRRSRRDPKKLKKKGWVEDPLYPGHGFRRNDPKIKKQIKKELRAISNLPPAETFKDLFIKYSTRIPILGRIFKLVFAGTIGAMIVAEAEEAYARDGAMGATLVLLEAAVDLTPIIGDVKGLAELMAMLPSMRETLMKQAEESHERAEKHREETGLERSYDPRPWGRLPPGALQ